MAATFLQGVRVLEVAEMVAGPYATKLLADLGADVIKVEGPAGDPARALGPFVGGAAHPERGIPFLHLNTSKRSVVTDEVADLVAGADIVVTDRDLGTAELLAAHPRLVIVELSPFGRSGPDAAFRATPLTTFHSAGEGYLTPVQSQLMPEVVQRPPLRQGRFAGEYKLATYVSMLALSGLYHARSTGVGQIIEVSKQDALIGLNFFEFAGYFRTGEPPTRASLGVRFGGILACADGYLQFTFHEDHQWRALARLMGDPDWTKEDWTATQELRIAHGDDINKRVTQWLSTRDRAEVVKVGQEVGCTVAAYLSLDEVAASEQMASRQFFRTVDRADGGGRYPTAPWRFSGVGAEPRAAARLGEHTGESWRARPTPTPTPTVAPVARSLPLEGIRVLDFTWAVAGPTATMFLASLGAEVIKVETAKRLDVIRRSPLTGSTTNREKKAITLNLADPRAIELAKSLVAHCDVVAESFRPGVMDAWGLGYDTLRAIRPDLVMLSSSMAGQRGPFSRFAGYAPMFVALSGLGDMTGYADGPPTQIRVGGDIIVGIHGGFSLLAALAHRQATGEGCHIDLSAIESQSCLVGDTLLDHLLTGNVARRSGNDEPAMAPHDCYRCAGDEEWVAIAVQTDAEWQALRRVLGEPAWSADDRFATGEGRYARRDELRVGLEEWTKARSARQVTEALQGVGVAASPSYRADRLFADPHVVSRQLVADVEGMGERWRLIRLGGKLSATPLRLERAGPSMGEHTGAVLGSLLGLSAQEIDQLGREGVLT